MKVSVESKSVEDLLREVEQTLDAKKINRAITQGLNRAGVGIRAQIQLMMSDDRYMTNFMLASMMEIKK